MRRRLWAVAAALCIASAGCSLEEEQPRAAAAPDAKAGGTLRVAIGRPASIDPNNAYEPQGELVVRTMCDTLLQQDPGSGELRGGLIESFQATDSGSKFVVRLRKDQRFSNGQELTADDVKSTLTRLASRDFAGFRQELLALFYGFPEVSGQVTTENDDLRDSLRGVRIIDSRSLELYLRSGAGGALQFRMGDYLGVFAEIVTTPVPRTLAQDDPASFESNPVCVGPYKLAAPWDGRADEIRLVRNPHYRGTNPAYTSGGRGYADEIVFHIYPTAAARAEALRSGAVDLAPLPDAEASGLRPPTLQAGTGPSIQFVGVPVAGTYADPRARAALSLALDRTRIAATVYKGLAEPARGFLSPALGDTYFRKEACDLRKGKTPDAAGDLSFPLFGFDTTPARADLPAAKGILADADVPLGAPPLKLRFNDEGSNRALATAVAEAWRALGIKVSLVPMPWKDYLAMATSSAGFDSAFLESWSPDYPGPDQYVGPLYTADGVGESNWSHFNNPALDTDLARYVRAQEEPEDLAVSYRTVERFLCANLPLIPVVLGKSAVGIDTTRLGTAAGRWLHHSTASVLLREIYRKDTT